MRAYPQLRHKQQHFSRMKIDWKRCTNRGSYWQSDIEQNCDVNKATVGRSCVQQETAAVVFKKSHHLWWMGNLLWKWFRTRTWVRCLQCRPKRPCHVQFLPKGGAGAFFLDVWVMGRLSDHRVFIFVLCWTYKLCERLIPESLIAQLGGINLSLSLYVW